MKLDEKFKTTEQKDFVDNYYNACSPTVQVCDLDKTHVMHIVPQKLWSEEILLDKNELNEQDEEKPVVKPMVTDAHTALSKRN